MDLSYGETGFIFCAKHPLLVTRVQVSDPGSLFYVVFLGALSSLAIILLVKRKLVALLLSVFCVSFSRCHGLVCSL